MGAGVIVVKWIGDQWKVLALVPPPHIQKKNGGTYDIPKGVMDKGESAWHAAIREAFEEASLILGAQEVIAGPYKDHWLTVWLCEIMETENGQVQQNPQSGIWEHESLEWLDFSEMKAGCYHYLRPFIEWAELELQNIKSLYTT